MKLQLGFLLPIVLSSACSAQVQLGSTGSESKMVATGNGEAAGAQPVTQQPKPDVKQQPQPTSQTNAATVPPEGGIFDQKASGGREIAGSFLTYEVDCSFLSIGGISCKLYEVSTGQRIEAHLPYDLKFKTTTANGTITPLVSKSDGTSAVTYSATQIGLDSKCFDASSIRVSDLEVVVDEITYSPKLTLIDQEKYFCKTIVVENLRGWSLEETGSALWHILNPAAEAVVRKVRYHPNYGSSPSTMLMTLNGGINNVCQISMQVNMYYDIHTACPNGTFQNPVKYRMSNFPRASSSVGLDLIVESRSKKVIDHTCIGTGSTHVSGLGGFAAPTTTEKICLFSN